MEKRSRKQDVTPSRRSKSRQKRKLGGVKAPPSADQAWQEFESALASALDDLDEDEYLVIALKPTGGFVQFAAQGAHGMRVEAVSNAYLPESAQLSQSAATELVNLGWNAPTFVPVQGVQEPAEGSPNFYLDAAMPVPYARLAGLAVGSLRKVYLARHPGELEYSARGPKGMQIRFPSLKLKRSVA